MASRIMDTGVHKTLRVKEIKESKNPQRSFIDPEKMEDLKRSINEKGVLQPPGVNELPDGTKEIIWGSRRLQALKELKFETEHFIVFSNLTPLEVRILRIIENLHQDSKTNTDEEDDIYGAWQEWQKTYENKQTTDLGQSEYARQLGLERPTLNRILTHAEFRIEHKSPEVLNATPNDIDLIKRVITPKNKDPVKRAKESEVVNILLRGMERPDKTAETRAPNGPIGGRSLHVAAEAVVQAPEECKKVLAERMADGTLEVEKELKGAKVIEIAQTLKEVPRDVQLMLLDKKITPTVAKQLVKTIKDPEEREGLVRNWTEDRLTEKEQLRDIETEEIEVKAPMAEIPEARIKGVLAEFEESDKKYEEWRNSPDGQELWRLSNNSKHHMYLGEALETVSKFPISCPKCKADASKLRWVCCDISAKDAVKLAHEEYQRGLDKNSKKK